MQVSVALEKSESKGLFYIPQMHRNTLVVVLDFIQIKPVFSL